jgi:vitamin B12 transporter
VSAFDNKIDNMISGWPAQNTAKAEIKGVELGASTQLAGWDVSTNLTVQSPKDKLTGKPLTYRPKQM